MSIMGHVRVRVVPVWRIRPTFHSTVTLAEVHGAGLATTYEAGWAGTLVVMTELPGPDPTWETDDPATEWWPALPGGVSPLDDDDVVALPQTVPGGMDRLRATVPLLNAQRVPPGTHHDVTEPIPVTATLRWETGEEQLDTMALEWWTTERDGAVVRVRISDSRVMTGAVWVPAADVRRR